MINKKLFLLFMILIVVAFLEFGSGQVFGDGFLGGNRGTASFTSYGANYNRYYGGGRANTYWPVLNDVSAESCVPTQDLIIQVSPAGCQPMVVRSDLLAEQNVPVFCQLDALVLNPSVDIKQIRNIRFTGKYPEEVAGVGFHPARAALRTTNALVGSPIESNIGYIVVVLKRQPNERDLKEILNFTLQASVEYYSGNALGIGKREFLLKEVSDEEWKLESAKQTFGKGLYSARLRDSEPNNAIVEFYQGDIRFNTLRLEKGKTESLFIPGAYCQTQLEVRFNSLISADKVARLQVNEDIVDVQEGGSFLNGKCRVRKIDGNGSLANVEVVCQRERFELGLATTSVKKNDKVYLIENNEIKNDKEWLVKEIVQKDGLVSYKLEGVDKEVPSYLVVPVSKKGFYEAIYGTENEGYFKNAVDNYESLVENYPAEKKDGIDETYAQTALERAIRIAIDYRKEATAFDLINKYFEKYPESGNTKSYKDELLRIGRVNSERTSRIVDLDNEAHIVILKDIVDTGKKSGAKISWGRGSVDLKEGGTERVNGASGVEIGKISLNKVIDAETIEVTTTCNDKDLKGDRNKRIRVRDTGYSPCGFTLIVSDVDVQSFAKVSINPRVRTGALINVSVGVGIEKRDLELTPGKVEDRLKNLNKSVQEFEKISEGLGKLVSGLKTACFGTTAVLTVKNFFTGLSGEATARQQVMRGDNGWTKWCSGEVAKGTYFSLNACFNENADKIGQDVKARTEAISHVNNEIEKLEEPLTKDGNLELNNARTKLLGKINEDCGDVNTGISGDHSSVGGLLSNANANQMSYEQLRNIYFECVSQKRFSGGLSERGREINNENIKSVSSVISERVKFDEQEENVKNTLKNLGIDSSKGFVDVTGENSKTVPYYGEKVRTDATEVLEEHKGKPVKYMTVNNKRYVFVLNEEKGSFDYTIDEIYEIKGGNNLVVLEDNGVKSKFSERYTFKKKEGLNYRNVFAQGEARVRYFDREPYLGKPAIVPFDVNNGWYVATKQSLPLLGGVKTFEDNGSPSSFWVCNVMDGKVDFFSSDFGNDECVQFNKNTGQPFDVFPGLSEGETKNLVSRAIRALGDAESNYKKGNSQVKILGQSIGVGDVAPIIPGTQCQDYMSPEDCRILFNVCDPVICPASRCDFGGTYRVADVVQSGVIGSLLLCLPNFNEGIAVPVCLTGIHAGLDGYTSILKSHMQCLQENLDTGKYVGICDQITSVYSCEFFWRQAAPLADVLIPKTFELLTGGGRGARGGGEYLTVKDSWQNAQDSFNYVTQDYAANSIQAFRLRSAQEIGSSFCNGFIGFAGPDSFEALVQPDSPVQFHAWFSSIPFTEATVPATSQYKVFYHIFAGKDTGVNYQVYLKDPPNSAYYTSPTVVVGSGFIPRGEFATETKDFTAPLGYQQLCVRVNNKEECGFKQVSTSFAVNYVRDKIVQDELNRSDIKSESECVSGSANAAALLNPNLQSGVEEAINPAIYNRGIVRICATSNPGIGTNPSRFARVGHCGNERVGCWLDKNGIDNAITEYNIGARNESLSEFQRKQDNFLKGDESFESSDVIQGKINELKGLVDKAGASDVVKIDEKIIDVLKRTLLNAQRAQLLMLKGNLYENVFKKALGKLGVSVKSAGSSGGGSEEGKNGGENSETPGRSTGNVVSKKYIIKSDKVYFDSLQIDLLIIDKKVIYFIDPVDRERHIIKSAEDSRISFEESSYYNSPENLRDHLLRLDGANVMLGRGGIVVDGLIKTCNVNFVQGNKVLEDGGKLTLENNFGLQIKIENCGVDSKIYLNVKNNQDNKGRREEITNSFSDKKESTFAWITNNQGRLFNFNEGIYEVSVENYKLEIDKVRFSITGESNPNEVVFKIY